MYTDRVVYCLPFNSRPLKEVDFVIHIHIISLELSIHDLSRRSTRARQTRTGRMRSFNSRPLKEVDSRRYRLSEFHRPFNSRPLKEVDTIRCMETTG